VGQRAERLPSDLIWVRGGYRHTIADVTNESGRSPAAPSQAFRRSLMRWWMVMLTSVLPGLIFLSGVLVDSTHGWEKIANGAGVLAFAIFGVRTARLGMFAGSEQLVVRDWFRTYQVRWSEIASFELPPPYGTWRKVGLRIHLVDGGLISATLYGQNMFDTGRRSVRAVIQELDRLRAQNSDRTAESRPLLALPDQQETDQASTRFP
jgi:hypothetical protein